MFMNVNGKPFKFDLSYQWFDNLFVLSHWEKRGSVVFWCCLCRCGNYTWRRTGDLRHGRNQSCGCLQKEMIASLRRTHNQAANGKSPEYKAWVGLRNRCQNPRNKAYWLYGGRGIGVCERWNLFENFLADVGPRPSPELSIHRINNDLGYFPGNVKWGTKSEQNTAKRRHAA
jgi:hypothetical protein